VTEHAAQLVLPLDASTFWDTSYVVNPELTDVMINEAQTRLGVTLPTELIELLRVQNGGYTAGFVFPTKVATSWADDHVLFNELAGINLDSESEVIFNLLGSTYLTEEWELPEKQVLLGGDGHYWITLDYRASDEPSVAWIGTEFGEDLQLAISFREFLTGLVEESVYEGLKQ
jgi:SMI1 / KNR4 family (SUKH-1)